jgi:exonuclease III
LLHRPDSLVVQECEHPDKLDFSPTTQRPNDILWFGDNKDKPYHIDYCFTSADLYDKVQDLEIGTYGNYMAHSDHTPLIINFNL